MGITEGRHAIMLENLFYLLCGLDTTYIKIGIKDKKYVLLVDSAYPVQFINPFESLAINIRIFNKFILRSQYCSDAIKRIISDIFELKVAKYLKELVEYRKEVNDVETLIIRLQDYIEEFDEMREIIDSIKNMNGVEVVNFLKDRRDKSVHFLKFYDKLMDPCIKKIKEEVNSWVLEGLILDDEFMVQENTGLDGFDQCIWTHKYTIIKENTPYFLFKEKNLIYNCGRIVNIGRKIFGNNILEIKKEYRTLGLVGLNNYLNIQFLESLKSDIEKEFDIMYKYLLLNEEAFYLDIFEELGNEMFLPTERTIIKINAIRGPCLSRDFSFKLSPVSLNEYILKILNAQVHTNYKKHLSILQSLTCSYNPVLLCNFISPKTFSELEIIFRFLFTLTSLSYYMNKFREFRFAKIVVLIIDHFRFILHSEMKPIEIRNDMNYVVNNFLLNIRKWLREFYLTSERIYCVWASIFDICFEFLNV